jgi:hypothetical protein
MTKDGEWVLISRLLARGNVPDDQRDQAMRDLMARHRIRYQEAGGKELPKADRDGKRPQHRHDRPPDAFLQYGRVNWLFSSVATDERMIWEVEILLPRTKPLTIAIAEAASPTGRRGRPSSKALIEAKARELLDSGKTYNSPYAFHKDVQRQVSDAHPGVKGLGETAVRGWLHDWSFKK